MRARAPIRCRGLSIPPALLLLAVGALAGGLLIARRPPPPAADLTIWTFDAEYADSFRLAPAPGERSAIQRFSDATGLSVRLELMPPRALDLRLMTLLRAPASGDAPPARAALPDVVHMETLSAAKFLDGPAGRIGLLPLGDRLESGALLDRLLPARVALWERHDHIYGVPLDVHPVTLTYRRDLFEAAGVDPSACETWDQLAVALERYCDHWRQRGRPHRRGLELARGQSDHLTLMLQQRGIDVVADDGRPSLDDERIVPLLLFYASLLAGPAPVAATTSEGHARWARDLARGDVAMIWTPDWRLEQLEAAAPQLAGRLAMMPLPRFAPGDAPTASWGGSMLAIPRDARDVEAAWALLRHLAFDEATLAARRRHSHMIPALSEPLPLAAGPELAGGVAPAGAGELYAQLAPAVRPQRVTMLTLAAWGHLAIIISAAADHLDAGGDASTLQIALRRWLADAQRDLERRREFAQ